MTRVDDARGVRYRAIDWIEQGEFERLDRADNQGARAFFIRQADGHARQHGAVRRR